MSDDAMKKTMQHAEERYGDVLQRLGYGTNTDAETLESLRAKNAALEAENERLRKIIAYAIGAMTPCCDERDHAGTRILRGELKPQEASDD